MLNGYTPEQAFDALLTIPPTIDHDTRAKVGMGAKDAGVTFDDYDAWQSTNPRYDAGEVRSMWHSFTDGPVKAGTLFSIAKEHGWTPNGTASPYKAPSKPARPPEPPRKPAAGMGASEVYDRCQPATAAHGYVVKKQGTPDGCRVVPDGDKLTIAGQSMAGYLAVPAYAPDGEIQSLQFIPPNGGKKLNLPGASMAGAMFTLGTDGPVYLCEGIGAAWSAWQATGHRAACCFGWGNIARVVDTLRQREPDAKLIVCPDVGKEAAAAEIAALHHCAVATMPEGWPANSDINDLFCSPDGGFDVVQAMLESVTEPPKPEPRYKLLNRDDLAALPALAWRVRGVLPAVGLAGLYGPSASGKSFLALDMAAAIADGERWFDCRVEAAPVVYAALEGEAGFKLRAQAWEAHKGRTLPDGLHMVLQPFKLTDLKDIHDLAAVVPAGAVVFLDTLNRAAPTADENSSKDMGEILEGAKRLQHLINGLVVVIHHTGKNTAAGLRGHSSLFAALDAAVEVSRDGDRREWSVAKSKDGADGDAQPFKLQIETLGTDAYGDAVTSCVVVADHAAADVRAVKLPQGGNQKVVLEVVRDLLKKAGPFNTPGAPATCPPGRPAIELEVSLERIAERLTVAPDRKAERAREAVTGLVSRGVLCCDKGWIWIA